MATIKFELFCDNGYSNCGIRETFEVDEEDLEDVPEEDQANYVWEKLGGKEAIFDNLDMGCFKSEDN